MLLFTAVPGRAVPGGFTPGFPGVNYPYPVKWSIGSPSTSK